MGAGGGAAVGGAGRARVLAFFKIRSADAHLLTARPLMAGAGVQQTALVESKASAATLLAVFIAAPSLQLRLHWLYIYRAVTQTSHCVIAVATGRLSARQDCLFGLARRRV